MLKNVKVLVLWHVGHIADEHGFALVVKMAAKRTMPSVLLTVSGGGVERPGDPEQSLEHAGRGLLQKAKNGFISVPLHRRIVKS
jgi:hypothetical protein